MALEDVEIETPICKTTVKMLAGCDVAVVPILRAGLGMVDGIWKSSSGQGGLRGTVQRS